MEPRNLDLSLTCPSDPLELPDRRLQQVRASIRRHGGYQSAMLDPQRLQAILERCRQAPCIAALGLTLIEADEGYCKMSARHDPRFNGLLPGFHGGMLANVADCVAWFAIVTQTGPDELLVTTDMHVRYLSPCNGDAIAVGQVIKLGKSLCPVRVDLYDTANTMVATCQVTYARVSNLGKPTG